MPKTIDNVPKRVYPHTKYDWEAWLTEKPQEFSKEEFAALDVAITSFRAQACAYAASHGFRVSVTQDAKTGSVYVQRRPGGPVAAIKRPKRTRPLVTSPKKGTKPPPKKPPAQK